MGLEAMNSLRLLQRVCIRTSNSHSSSLVTTCYHKKAEDKKREDKHLTESLILYSQVKNDNKCPNLPSKLKSTTQKETRMLIFK